jgi:pimeloyl-ACP methyl ester carboxylesterase
MNIIDLLRIKNKILGVIMPDSVANSNARLFLTPRRFKLKDWEKLAEQSARRINFAQNLSAAIWGNGVKKALLMHGWESRATHMYAFVEPLLACGYTVVAIDAPLHGHSQGTESNPLAFARAIVAASEELGPFNAAIGHSMGGAAISIAMEYGARFDRSVLLSSPSCLYNVLVDFARFMGLSEKLQHRFVRQIEKKVGRPSKELDVGRVFSELQPEALLIHADDDKEIPHHSMQDIAKAYPGLITHTVSGLGHRKVLRDPEIARLVAQYIVTGAVNEEPNHMSGGMTSSGIPGASS